MPRQVIYFAVGFLFLAVLPLPYGFYNLLRVIACAIFSWAAYISFEKNASTLPWIFIVLAIIFNPIIKIYFPKEIWVIVNICSGMLLLITKTSIQEESEENK